MKYPMAQLTIKLLGSFQVNLDGNSITKFESNKVRALLAYLVVESGTAHSREKLADIFWPDMPTKHANSNLSGALYNLRRQIHDHEAKPVYLIRSRDFVQFNSESDHWLDVNPFNEMLDGNLLNNISQLKSESGFIENFQAAIDLYRGDFLEGLSFDSSLAFDEWALFMRQRFQRQVLDGLHMIADYFNEKNEILKALPYAWRQVELDPLDERATRQLMQLLAANNQRSQALTQFERLQIMLANELKVAPEPETISLRDRIRGGYRPQGDIKPRGNNLPAFLTPVIGRQQELTEIMDQCGNPDCRLLTILGPGGSGKTRLALEVAKSSLENFPHGIFFIPLNPVQSPTSVLPAIVDVLDLPRVEKDDPQSQLVNYLRNKNLLLVLDGFEHLLDAAPWIAEILHQASQLQILVTSRTRLNIKSEQVFMLSGMYYPEEGTSQVEIQESDAVQLLVAGLRRTWPDYDSTLEDLDYLYQICQQVYGMPLGILLAASWGATLSIKEIAEMVCRSLDFLAADWADAPKRQRSLRATFDYTWKLLSEREQAIFQSLSVFRGAFTRQAARAVSGSTSHELRDLVDRSLLWFRTPGWYEVHELLRQYGREKLAQSTQVEQKVCDRHSENYLEQLARLGEDLKNVQQVAALSKIDLDHENYRAAWNWAAMQSKNDDLENALEGLCRYYELKIRYMEGESACQKAIDSLEETRSKEENWLLLSRLLIWASRFNRLLERFDQAKCELERANKLIEKAESVGFDTRWEQAMFLFESAEITANRDPEMAQMEYQRCLALYQELGDPWQIAMVQLVMGNLAAMYGDFVDAAPILYHCFAIFQDLGDIRGIAKSLYYLSIANVRLGEFDLAQQQIDESVALYRSIGDQANIAASLSGLGTICHWLGKYSKANDLFLDNLPICQELGDNLQITFSYFMIGASDLNSGRYQPARKYSLRSLELAREYGFKFWHVCSLSTLGWVSVVEQDYAKAITIFREAIIELRKMHNQSELCIGLVTLWYLEYHFGQPDLGWQYLQEAFLILKENKDMMIVCFAAFNISSFYTDRGDLERAIEFVSFAKLHPALANSCYLHDIYECPVIESAKSLPPKVVAAAQERGQERDIWETASELLAEFQCT